MRNRLVIEGVLLVVAFLLGFIPQYVKARHLDTELHAAEQKAAGAELRDLAAQAYLDASQKNYGLAADSSGRFFERAREAANHATDPARKSALQGLQAPHDKVMSELAKADPTVITDLADLFTRARQATAP